MTLSPGKPGSTSPALAAAAEQEGPGWWEHWPQLHMAGQRVRGGFETALRTRYSFHVAKAASLALFLYAAAPDFGFKVESRYALAGLALLWAATEYVQQLIAGREMGGYRATFLSLGKIISSLAGLQSGSGPQLLRDPLAPVEILLRRARDLGQASLKPPAGCTLTSSLLVPEWKGGAVSGLTLLAQDDFRPGEDHPCIPLDAPGAGAAFSAGKAVAVQNTARENHPRVCNRTYRSIGAFPIWLYDGTGSGRVVAILTLDATTPYVLTQHAVDELHPFIDPIAQLIGLVLGTTNLGRDT